MQKGAITNACMSGTPIALKVTLNLYCCCGWQGPADEPVWRQVLRLHLNHSNPEVAQQAAEALGLPVPA